MNLRTNNKIFLLTIEPPLPFGGAAARWFYVLVTELRKRGYQVKIFSICSKPDEMIKAQTEFSDITCFMMPQNTGSQKIFQKFNTLLRPFSYMFDSKILNAIEKELEAGQYDVIHLEQIWSGWAIPKKFRNISVLNIHHFMSIDIEGGAKKNLRSRYEYWQIERAEKYLSGLYPFVRTCSERLERKIKEWHPTINFKMLMTVPVGIDSSLYQYIENEKRSDLKMVSLIASMNWYPGFSAAKRLLDKLWPQIKKEVPGAKLQIIGWEAKKALKDYLDLPDIIIDENVPEVRPYFERANVFLYSPVRGSGMKIKILESMLFGIPVITTIEGIEGLEAKKINDLPAALVAEDDAGLISHAVRLLNNVDEQNKIRKNARDYIGQYCSPKNTVDGILQIYKKILEQGK